MAEAKRTRTRAGGRASAARTGRAMRRSGEDRGLAKVLAGRSVDKVVPEVSRRLESARQRHVTAAQAVLKAELALLDAEAARIETEGDAEGRAARRVARFRAAAAADAENARVTAAAIERMVTPERGGWSVVGRVLDRNGVPPKRAEVVFVDDEGAPVRGLSAVRVDTDGMVRVSFPKSVIEAMREKRVHVRTAVRIGRRIVATDATRAVVRPGRLHQFDLRLD